MPRAKTMMGRKNISLPADLWEAVDNFRFAHRLKAESEAIRRLIDGGLHHDALAAAFALYHQTVFQTIGESDDPKVRALRDRLHDMVDRIKGTDPYANDAFRLMQK